MLRTCSLLVVAGVVLAAELPSKADVEALIDQGQTFLLANAQPSGALVPGAKFTLGITQLAVESLGNEPKAIRTEDPRVAAAVTMILSFRQPDGSIQDPSEGLANYCTSLGILSLTAAKAGDAETIAKARDFLFGLQNTNAESPNRGGIGYGSKGAGHEDLSNTSYAINAFKAAGVKADDPRMKEALAFLERCQNLSSVNKLPWAGNDGGAVYAPDESKAGGSWDTAKGGAAPARMDSYGSMTYALISSYIAMDLGKDDPRVTAALGWVSQNYQFDQNPGMPKGKESQGLYYYYGAMAKTFDLLDHGPVTLPDGRKAAWQADLFATIKAKAKPTTNGTGVFWVNDADRWAEGLPQLVTSYTVRALKRIHASL